MYFLSILLQNQFSKLFHKYFNSWTKKKTPVLIFYHFLSHVLQGSCSSCTRVRCSFQRWSLCITGFCLISGAPSRWRSRCWKTSRCISRRRTHACRRLTESVSDHDIVGSTCLKMLITFTTLTAENLGQTRNLKLYKLWTTLKESLLCFYLFRAKNVKAGRSEGDGWHLFWYEQFYYAALFEAGAGVFLPHAVQRATLRPQCHRSDPQPGTHTPRTGIHTPIQQQWHDKPSVNVITSHAKKHKPLHVSLFFLIL